MALVTKSVQVEGSVDALMQDIIAVITAVKAVKKAGGTGAMAYLVALEPVIVSMATNLTALEAIPADVKADLPGSVAAVAAAIGPILAAATA